MRMRSRPVLVLWLTLLCCLLIYGAVLVGRGTQAGIVAGRDRDSAVSPMDVLLIDYSRGLSIRRRIQMPFAIRANWDVSPPQVLMRIPDGESVIFQLSELNLSHLRLEPLVTHRVSATPRPRDLEAVFSGQRGALYSPAAGEISLVEDGVVIQQGVTVTENSSEMVMAWSPDGSRVAVKDFRSARMIVLDGITITQINTLRDAAPVWLDDSRAVVLAQAAFVGRNGRIRVVDTVTGEINQHTEGLNGRSAAMCGTETLGYVDILSSSENIVRTLDLATGEARTVLETGRVEHQDIGALAFAPRPACDWMLVEMRHPDNMGTRLYRLHLSSGDLTVLGDNTRVLELTAQGVIYESTTARVALTVSRAAFEIGTEPELYGRIPAQGDAILWLDGYRRGLFLRDGQLWSLDLATGTRPLTLPVRLQDIQLVPPK